ncbi:MAG TPA: hypothetical protein VGR76_19010, partial [Candidatus Angelobacter sp.]|nr:hypothetical protein [Candidatus Angelobacter sp.]
KMLPSLRLPPAYSLLDFYQKKTARNFPQVSKMLARSQAFNREWFFTASIAPITSSISPLFIFVAALICLPCEWLWIT